MTSPIIPRIFNSSLIEQRSIDGFINGTAMARANDKDISDWLKTEPTFELVSALASRLGISPTICNARYTKLSKGRIPAMYPTLVISRMGSPESGGGTWIHPDLSDDLFRWATKRKDISKELVIKNKLHAIEGGKLEVKVPGGRIDLLTDTQIIEIKSAKRCVSAVGQILVYGKFYPDHQKRIHLFDDASYKLLKSFEEVCKDTNIIVTFDL